jgi:hypothetical protein
MAGHAQLDFASIAEAAAATGPAAICAIGSRQHRSRSRTAPSQAGEGKLTVTVIARFELTQCAAAQAGRISDNGAMGGVALKSPRRDFSSEGGRSMLWPAIRVVGMPTGLMTWFGREIVQIGGEQKSKQCLFKIQNQCYGSYSPDHGCGARGAPVGEGMPDCGLRYSETTPGEKRLLTFISVYWRGFNAPPSQFSSARPSEAKREPAHEAAFNRLPVLQYASVHKVGRRAAQPRLAASRGSRCAPPRRTSAFQIGSLSPGR